MWTWTLPPEFGDPRKRMLFNIGMPAAVVAMVGLGITFGERTLIIIGVMTFGIYLLGLAEISRTRRFLVTIADGSLTIDDGRQARSMAVAEITEVKVRHRSSTGGGRWSVEALGAGKAVTRSIPAYQGWINVDEATAADLEQQLNSQLGLAKRSATLMQGFPAPEPRATGIEAGDFEWSPRVSPKAERNRKRIRFFMLGAALAVAVYAGISERDSGTVGVILSVTVVPGLIVGFWAVIDWLYRVGRGTRVAVADGQLVIQRSARAKPVSIPTQQVASVTVDSSVQTNITAETHTRTTVWLLTVTDLDGNTTKTQLGNGFGLATTRDDYAMLEAELKARVG